MKICRSRIELLIIPTAASRQNPGEWLITRRSRVRIPPPLLPKPGNEGRPKVRKDLKLRPKEPGFGVLADDYGRQLPALPSSQVELAAQLPRRRRSSGTRPSSGNVSPTRRVWRVIHSSSIEATATSAIPTTGPGASKI